MKKNYIKLIGSIMCAFSMIMTVALVAIGAQANDKKITYVENVTCSELKKEPTAPAEYESGYLFAGWYVKGGEKPNKDGYSPVEEPVVGTSYVAKYVPSEVLGVKAQVSGQIVDNDTDKITNNAVDNAIRFITSLDSKEYNHIGFNIKIQAEGEDPIYNKDAATTKSVYRTVYGIGADKDKVMKEYTPNIFHNQSEYFKTYTFTTIPESAFDSYITVTPYWITLDGTRVNGPETAVKTVNYGRAWYYVDDTVTDKNTDVPLGTVSNPYTTLAEAMNVEAELNPRLILKNDITVNETVNVDKTMTIAGLKTADPAKKITYNTDETGKYIFTVAETGNITLEDLHLSGGERAIQNTGGAFTATNVEISDCADKGIQLNGGTANLTDVTIKGGVRGLQLYSSANVTGNNVKIYGPTEYGVACGGASTLDITSLTVDGKLAEENKLANHALNVYEGSEVTITGGDITNLTTGNGVNAANAIVTLTDVDIAYDEAATGSYEGIKAFKENEVAAEVILSGVTITNAPEHGIQIWQGSSVTGTNVTITTPGSSGILCADADSQFDISTLTISGSESHGINLNDNGFGKVTGGSIQSSGGKGIYLWKNNVAGASIELSNVQINNSTHESLYLNNASSATVNGTLTTQGGTHALAIYGASTVEAGTGYEKITIGTHSSCGVRIYDSGSKLDVADMDITGGTQGIEVGTNTTVNLTGDINLSGMSGSADTAGNGIYIPYSGATLNAVNATITINKVGFNAVYVKNGTINASTSIINLTGGCNYGLRANGGTTTIGELNIDGAKAHSAVRAQGSASVTINGGTIKNSAKCGVNALDTAVLTMNNVTVSNSGSGYVDIMREEDTATINLTNVTYTTGYGKE